MYAYINDSSLSLLIPWSNIRFLLFLFPVWACIIAISIFNNYAAFSGFEQEPWSHQANFSHRPYPNWLYKKQSTTKGIYFFNPTSSISRFQENWQLNVLVKVERRPPSFWKLDTMVDQKWKVNHLVIHSLKWFLE